MNDDKKLPKKHRKWRRFFFFLLILPPLLCFFGNLFFATPFGTGLISSRIEKRSGLICEIDQISWTPWSGGSIRNLVLFSPESSGTGDSVVKVEQVRLDPSWLKMFQKKFQFSELRVKGVQVDMPLELFKDLEEVARGPLLISEPESDLPLISDQAMPQIKPPNLDVSDEDQTVKVDPSKAESLPEKLNEEKTPLAQKKSYGDNQSIIFEDVSIRLFSLQKESLNFEILDLSGELPFGGKPRAGHINIDEVSVAGEPLLSQLNFPLEWKEGVLQMNAQVLKMKNVEVVCSAAVSPVRGIPYGFQVNAREEGVDVGEMTGARVPATIGAMVVDYKMQGYLTNPRLVYGSGRAAVSNVRVKDLHDQSEVIFDEGYLSLSLTPAGVAVPVFRLLGEEDAILGNGFLTTRAEGTSVVRLVGSENRVEAYERRAREWKKGFDLQMKPLLTPDRWYSDIRFDLSSRGLVMEVEEESVEEKIP